MRKLISSSLLWYIMCIRALICVADQTTRHRQLWSLRTSVPMISCLLWAMWNFTKSRWQLYYMLCYRAWAGYIESCANICSSDRGWVADSFCTCGQEPVMWSCCCRVTPHQRHHGDMDTGGDSAMGRVKIYDKNIFCRCYIEYIPQNWNSLTTLQLVL